LAALLLITIFLPLAGAVLVWPLAAVNRRAVPGAALLATLATFVLACVVVGSFLRAMPGDALFAETNIPWLGAGSGVDIRLTVALDGISLWLFALSALLMVTAVLISWKSIDHDQTLYYSMLLLLASGCLGVFTAQDIILFYVFFEFTLIPLFFLIGVWGSEERRYAAIKFFLFTLAGSLLTFLGLLTIVLWGAGYVGVAGAWHDASGVRPASDQPLPLTFNIRELQQRLSGQYAETFRVADENKDGKLTLVEASTMKQDYRVPRARSAFLQAVLAKYDADYDGALALDELTDRRSGADQVGLKDLYLSAFLLHYDRNHNERLELFELAPLAGGNSRDKAIALLIRLGVGTGETPVAPPTEAAFLPASHPDATRWSLSKNDISAIGEDRISDATNYALTPGDLAHFSAEAIDRDAKWTLTKADVRAADFNLQLWVFLALFIGFAIKVPLFPLHTWLPLAHVQAPAAGSVILAGILLKIGTYGFLRFNISLLPDATAACVPWLLWLSVAGIIYGALVALAQSDMKKLIAYSSVSHLGFCMLGLFALNSIGTQGSVLQMVNHGISTGGLFAIVGMLYERYHTRAIKDYSGLAKKLPIAAFFMIVFTFSSIGVPGLNGFAGEFLILLGMFQRAWESVPFARITEMKVISVLAVSGVVLGAWYMLWLVQRVFFGPLKEPHGDSHADHGQIHDLNFREIAALAPLAVLALWIGLWPQFFLAPLAKPLETTTAAARQHLELDIQDTHLASDEPSLAPQLASKGVDR
jgi:NADH:ubiquinone oxidoreductase subunit 4 (subunit M)